MTTAEEHLKNLSRWWSHHGSVSIRSSDALAGAVAGVGAGLLSALEKEVRVAADPVLFAVAAFGVALLAVALTALAILVGLLDENFLHVLRRASKHDDLGDAIAPYQLVSSVSGLATVIATGSVFIRHSTLWWVDSLLIGATIGLGVWAAFGTVSLVNLTAYFGIERGKLIGHIADARSKLGERKGA